MVCYVTVFTFGVIWRWARPLIFFNCKIKAYMFMILEAILGFYVILQIVALSKIQIILSVFLNHTYDCLLLAKK